MYHYDSLCIYVYIDIYIYNYSICSRNVFFSYLVLGQIPASCETRCLVPTRLLRREEDRFKELCKILRSHQTEVGADAPREMWLPRALKLLSEDVTIFEYTYHIYIYIYICYIYTYIKLFCHDNKCAWPPVQCHKSELKHRFWLCWVNQFWNDPISRIYEINHYSCKLESCYDSDEGIHDLTQTGTFGPMMLIPTCARHLSSFAASSVSAMRLATEGVTHAFLRVFFWTHNPPNMYVLYIPAICFMRTQSLFCWPHLVTFDQRIRHTWVKWNEMTNIPCQTYIPKKNHVSNLSRTVPRT